MNEQVAREVAVDARAEDERAAAAGPFEPLLAGQLAERPADGDEAAAVALREVALRGEPVAGTPFARIQGRAQVKVDLVVQRDRAELESEAGHRAGRTSGRRGWGIAGLVQATIADNVISNRVKPRCEAREGGAMGLKIAVVGGGSTYTPELVEGFEARRDRMPIDELVLARHRPATASRSWAGWPSGCSTGWTGRVASRAPATARPPSTARTSS